MSDLLATRNVPSFGAGSAPTGTLEQAAFSDFTQQAQKARFLRFFGRDTGVQSFEWNDVEHTITHWAFGLAERPRIAGCASKLAKTLMGPDRMQGI